MIDHDIIQRPAVSKAQTVPPVTEFFQSFMSSNPGSGAVVFEVHEDSPVKGRIPVKDARITVSRLLGNDYYLSKIVTTNENGESDPAVLPTVSRELSLKPGEGRVFATYHASVEAPGYRRRDLFDIQIFDGITSIQHVNMTPVPAGVESR